MLKKALQAHDQSYRILVKVKVIIQTEKMEFSRRVLNVTF